MTNNPGTPTHTRRTILKVGGTLALAGFTASGSAIAQTDLPLEIEQNAEDEYVVIRNIGDEEVDISNYQINFEAGEDSNVDQIRQLPSDVVIGAGDEIIVPTGALEVSGDNVVQLTDPYDTEMLNNEDPDVVALLDPDDNVVVSTDETTDGDGGDGGDGDGDETHTLTLTIIDPDEDPVADANIGIVTYDGGEDVASGTTDENGQATFELPNGSYEISARTEGYVNPSDDRLVGIDGEDVERTIQLVPFGSGDDEDDTEEDDTDTCTLTVTITDPNGDPVEGLPVVLATYDDGEEVARTTTDADGKARFDVPAGSYEIVEIVEDSEYTSYGTHPVTVRSDTEYSIQLIGAPESADDTDDGSDDTEDEDASGDAPDESGDETDESADETDDDDCPKR